MPDLTATPHFSTHLAGTSSLMSALAFTGKGTVNAITCYNGSSATIYLHLFDSADLPTDSTSEPTFAPIPIAATGYYESTAQRGFSTGCAIGISSASAVYTEADQTGVKVDVGGIR